MLETGDPLEVFRKEIIESIRSAFGAMGYGDCEITLITPPIGMGDFAFPCFEYAKKIHQNPATIAERLVSIISGKMVDIERVEATGGYVNFHLSNQLLARETLAAIHSLGSSYGAGKNTEVNVLLEHTSANPTGPLHIGRARNPIIGDTLARILRLAGYTVTTEYYVNDIGKQAAMLISGVMKYSERKNADGCKPDHRYVLFYQSVNAEIEGGERDTEEKIENTLLRLEKGEPDALALADRCIAPVMEGIIQTLREVNITFDRFTKESSFIRSGDVDSIVKKLDNLSESGEEDGARYLDMERLGLQGKHTRFFYTRKDGTTLYTTRDIAYHYDKFKRCDIAVNVLGEDQKRAMDQLRIALDLLGMDPDNVKKLRIVYYSFVSLPEGRMSTRKGKVVYMDDLIEEAIERARKEVRKRRTGELSNTRMDEIARVVGIGAIRYNIVRIQPEKQIVFRWEDALNFEGNSAPFIQYSNARACSILRNAIVQFGKGIEIFNVGNKATEYEKYATLLIQPSEKALIKKIAEFPSIIQECARQMKVHIVANYAHEVANSFNQFYRDCPVLAAETDLRNARLFLVEAVRLTLSSVLSCLGIDAPEEM